MLFYFYFILPYFILILAHITQHAGSLFPDQELNLFLIREQVEQLNLFPLQWKHRFLSTGLLGESPDKILSFRFYDFFFGLFS